ncbi:hypothetical protein ACFWVP_02970 [Streptomyces sp. NPDC058637]|uniref:hypothetical protein n=1 Tax=Streptomyces sp. NPDC058637 TaxID=3346569 RepID=UPI003647FCB8
MSAATAMPGDLARWVTRTVGPVSEVRSASRERAGSRVWEVIVRTDVRYFVKVAPEPAFYTRETFAYRHVVPVLGGGRAAALVDSSPRRPAMVLTAVDGVPLDRRSLSHGVRREAHRQAGTLLRGAFFGGYGRRLSEAEQHALVCFAAADAAGCLARGARNGGRPVTERGRRTVDRLMKGAYA